MELLGMQTGYNQMSAQKMPHWEPNKIAGTSPVNVGKWERYVSGALGAFLVYRAIRNRNWSALLMAPTGLSLLNRGVSGYCPAYNKLKISSTNT
jgi:uncharacterized membrane protein